MPLKTSASVIMSKQEFLGCVNKYQLLRNYPVPCTSLVTCPVFVMVVEMRLDEVLLNLGL